MRATSPGASLPVEDDTLFEDVGDDEVVALDEYQLAIAACSYKVIVHAFDSRDGSHLIIETVADQHGNPAQIFD